MAARKNSNAQYAVALGGLALLLLCWGRCSDDVRPSSAPGPTAVPQAPAAPAVATVPPDEVADVPVTAIAASGTPTASVPQQEHEVVVEVVDSRQQPVAGCEVWLAERWLALHDLVREPSATKVVTDAAGFGRWRLRAGRWLVHAVDDERVCSTHSLHGNGANAVLAVPSQLRTRVVLQSVYAIAYEITGPEPALWHTLQGAGMRGLHTGMDPALRDRLAAIEARVRARFPKAHVSAYACSSESAADLGRWEVRALAAWREPVRVPVRPQPVRELVAPTSVDPSQGIASAAFGRVLVRADGIDQGQRLPLAAERLSSRPGVARGPELTGSVPVVLGEVAVLPVGLYRLVVQERPFVGSVLPGGGEFTVAENGWQVLDLPPAIVPRQVVLEFVLPAGESARPFYGAITQRQSGLRVPLLAHAVSEVAVQWLPVGAYDFDVHIALDNPSAGELRAAGSFEVSAGSGASTVAVPFALHPLADPRSTPR